MSTRLEKILAGEDKDHVIRHPEDVARLKKEIPQLAKLSAVLVQEIYNDWSEMEYSASWMDLMEDVIEEFRAYLLEEM